MCSNCVAQVFALVWWLLWPYNQIVSKARTHRHERRHTMNAENKAKAIKRLNWWGNEAKAAWADWNDHSNKAAHHRYEQMNERVFGFMSALDVMGFEVVLDDSGFVVTDIVAK